MQENNAYYERIYQPARRELVERFRELSTRNTANQTYDLCESELESLALFWVQDGWSYMTAEKYDITPYLQKTIWSMLVKTLREDLMELHLEVANASKR